MNRTTVKRGIGAVILALVAAALLAFLLKDKAAQRQEVVEIALPGTDGSIQTTDQTSRLPTLTTDNSGNGSVIANAGAGSGNEATNAASANGATGNEGATSGSGSNPDGTIVASAAAIGAVAAGTAAATTATVGDAAESIDFSVKPKISKASSEFLDLDLVNNGQTKAVDASASASAAVTTAAAATTAQAAAPKSTENTDQGVVIASTTPKSSGARANAVQPRLIGEKRSAPVKSSRTAKVVTKQTSTKSGNTSSTSVVNKPTSGTAKNGYAIQLLATSSSTRANNLKNVMAGEGYPTYVTKTKQNGKTLYRVRIGQYTTKSKALTAHAAMKRRYKKNTNVNRSAVVAR